MIYMPTQKKWEKQIYAKKKGGVVFVLWHLGDNCIVFENFMASIGDLMVANWVEQISATIISTTWCHMKTSSLKCKD